MLKAVLITDQRSTSKPPRLGLTMAFCGCNFLLFNTLSISYFQKISCTFNNSRIKKFELNWTSVIAIYLECWKLKQKIQSWLLHLVGAALSSSLRLRVRLEKTAVWRERRKAQPNRSMMAELLESAPCHTRVPSLNPARAALQKNYMFEITFMAEDLGGDWQPAMVYNSSHEARVPYF